MPPRKKVKRPKKVYPKQYVGTLALVRRGLKKKPKIGRKSPAISALARAVGQVMRGQDGNLWIVKARFQRGKRTHYWSPKVTVADLAAHRFRSARKRM